jgi:adiponectin receptor
MIFQGGLCFLVFLSSLWSEFDKPKWRVLRGSLFLALGISGIFPFGHIMIFLQGGDNLPFFEGGVLWIVGGGLYIIGAIIYMLRIPERWKRNTFDFFVISAGLVTYHLI